MIYVAIVLHQCQLDAELKRNFKTVLPYCEDWKLKGPPPVRPYGKELKTCDWSNFFFEEEELTSRNL